MYAARAVGGGSIAVASSMPSETSARISDVRVKDRGVIRRAKLYFLREREGKATRLTRNLGKLKWPRSGAGSGVVAEDKSAEAAADE